MLKQSRFLYRTTYFQRKWTWIRRIFAIIFLAIGTLFLPFEAELQFLKFIAAAVVILYFLVKPKDDLAVTNEALIHIKKSIVNIFTRVDQYKISELASIRCGGVHSDGWELVDFFNGRGTSGGYYNTVEMIFKNGGSKSLRLPIDRQKLDTVVKIIYDLKSRT